MTTTAKPGTRRRLPRGVWWLLAALAVGGGGAAIYLSRQQSSQTAGAAAQPQTATATPGDLRVSVSGPGTVAAAQTQTAQPQVTGRILSLPQVGQRVNRGELVARIDPTSAQLDVTTAELALQKAQAALETARAGQSSNQAASVQSTGSADLAVQTAQLNLQSAQQTLRSNQDLFAIGGVSKQVVDDARTAVQKAQADLETAQLSARNAGAQSGSKVSSDAQSIRSAELAVAQARVTLQQAQQSLGYTKVYAPISGVVSEVPLSVGTVAVGNSTQSAQTLFTVVDTTSVTLPVQIDETQIAGVQVGQPADVTLDAIDGRTFRGRVSTVSPAATVSNNIAIFTVTVKIPNPDGALRPGMSAEAEIISQELANTLLIPKKAVETVRTRSYVQLVGQGGQAERHRVRTGPDDGTSIAVTSGLKPGDQVLLPAGTRSTSGSSTTTNRNQNNAFPGPPPGGN